MSQEPVFERIANLLVERLRGEMVPAVLNQGDDIKLTYPGAETDYRFGVFLYDLEEVRPYGPPASVRIGCWPSTSCSTPTERCPLTAWARWMRWCFWRGPCVRYTVWNRWKWTAGR